MKLLKNFKIAKNKKPYYFLYIRMVFFRSMFNEKLLEYRENGDLERLSRYK